MGGRMSVEVATGETFERFTCTSTIRNAHGYLALEFRDDAQSPWVVSNQGTQPDWNVHEGTLEEISVSAGVEEWIAS